MERQTVAIITDDQVFAGALTRRWLDEPNVPAFLFLREQAELRAETSFDLAVAVRLGSEHEQDTLDLLKLHRKPVILVRQPNTRLKVANTDLTVLPEVPEWSEIAVAVGKEILRRQQVHKQLDSTQQLNSALQREASLGRYMLEVRHNLNNALTSVLGNSDLILLDTQQLPTALCAQVETIRNMSMRMNEILQRFSSLQKEMELMEQQPITRAHAAGR